jgi:uncharacterized Zn-binding protein involved in type VI secretion
MPAADPRAIFSLKCLRDGRIQATVRGLTRAPNGRAQPLCAATGDLTEGVMFTRSQAVIAAALVYLATAGGAGAQETPAGAGVPGVVTGGSSTTSVGGQAAARKGDATDGGGVIIEGSKNVFIDGRPAAVLGDKTNCGGITIGGAGNVLINGKPAARAGDLTTGCAGK